MKIIGISNYNLDNVSDILIASNVNKYYGRKIIEYLQSKTTDNDRYYPELVDDDYELYKWKP